jgi:D-glycero-beta-D-manno-heptose 1-phosphate adenylyltransferase
MNPDKLHHKVSEWKRDNKKIVFTNGCFDILHVGHLDYLEHARNMGDKLVIGINTNDSVSRIKGPSRPVNDEYSRSRALAALSFVDAVVFFNEDTPYDLISAIKPDILVKGGDYLAENIVGADIVKENGGEVKTIPFTTGFSTTSFIERIKTI